MKQLTISKAALRILVFQLEAKGDGFNIKQLRLLDKSATILTEPIEDYNAKIDKYIKDAEDEVANDPTQTKVAAVNKELNTNLDAITANEGEEEVSIQLEDEQFNFIKEIWDASAGYKGKKELRILVLQVDDALNAVVDVKNQYFYIFMNPNGQSQGLPQKIIDFNEELKALCDKYQYELRATVQFDPSRGLFPTMQVFDVTPKEKGVPLNPADSVPSGKTDLDTQAKPTVDNSGKN